MLLKWAIFSNYMMARKVDDVRFTLDQHAQLDFDSATTLTTLVHGKTCRSTQTPYQLSRLRTIQSLLLFLNVVCLADNHKYIYKKYKFYLVFGFISTPRSTSLSNAVNVLYWWSTKYSLNVHHTLTPNARNREVRTIVETILKIERYIQQWNDD